VKITFTEVHNWKIEAHVSYVKQGRTFSGTAARWMSQWDHSVQAWADAIQQVMGGAGAHRHCFQWNGDFWMQCECGHYPSEAEIKLLEKT
jgi:hypothetical protein